jgi:integrase
MPDTESHHTPTLADAWERWLAYRSVSPRPLRLSTLADYRSAYRRHIGPRLGTMPLSRIDGAMIAQFVVDLADDGVAAKRRSNILVPLRARLSWHHRIGEFARDPAGWFDAPAPAADERRILTLAEVERLVEATPRPYRAFVATAAWTGMRLGELRALTWADIDLNARLITVDKTRYRQRVQRATKNGDSRVVPIPPHLAVELAAWRRERPPAPDDLVFCGKRGTPIDGDDFRRRVFAPALVQAGLDPATRIHDLRHTSASLYLASGATVREVMEIHGWRRMETALRYLHTTAPLTDAAERLSAARDADLRTHGGPDRNSAPPANGGTLAGGLPTSGRGFDEGGSSEHIFAPRGVTPVSAICTCPRHDVESV